MSLCIAFALVSLSHNVCRLLFLNGLSEARFEKRAPATTGGGVPIVAEPVTGQPYGSRPPGNRSGIADGEHGVLGTPMQMQCKETHKCSQNKIS